MKLNIALTLLTAAAVNADVGYTPVNDVNDHSLFGADVTDIQTEIKAGNATGALALYTMGAGNRDKDQTIQDMANKDWAAAGAPDEIKKAYEAVLGESFADTFTTDAINCNESFEGSSDKICEVAAVKNLHCTALSYAQYEGSKSIATGSEKNWDELFAFWYGVYDETNETYLGKGGARAVQKSRDGNFGTDFQGASFKALNDGQKAVQAGDTEAQQAAFDAFHAAIVGTFAQATLKYAVEMNGKTEQVDIDGKYAEGYTYFRCAAGLFDPEFATYINGKYDPRGVAAGDEPDLYCDFAKKMADTGDLGYGVMIGDLGLTNFEALANVETDCDISLAAKEPEEPEEPESASGTFGYVATAMTAFAANLFL